MDGEDDHPAACSECFHNQGLKLDAQVVGFHSSDPCPRCGSTTGSKLNKAMIGVLAHRFFVWGTTIRCDYGAAPVIQFNNLRKTDIDPPLRWLESDMKLIEASIGVGFFIYGPRLWMVGEFDALREFTDPATRSAAIGKVLNEYPTKTLHKNELFYRIRKAPSNPAEPREYDSPPLGKSGSGRLDALDFPIMYGSPDLQVCVHECRVTAEDELYVATLAPTRDLKLLDLTELLEEKDVTEFESIDLAVHMIFLAGAHSYEIARAIAVAAKKAGYDGLIFPSYFSLLRTGGMPFETVMGISHRRISQLADRERSKTVPNYAIFGRPIEKTIVQVKVINRLMLNRVDYGLHFGPVGFVSENI